eukprot:TRINITY_DN2198_c0_g1_i2.p1 TRINITY_DN2198_c0_g1~~TRINITY_DN2198_c0_g1_i2.p1  ORF type:complete len:688 (-),score=91.14 TRINITY_DN2198_c0_g1_i2:296-2359(-)
MAQKPSTSSASAELAVALSRRRGVVETTGTHFVSLPSSTRCADAKCEERSLSPGRRDALVEEKTVVLVPRGRVRREKVEDELCLCSPRPSIADDGSEHIECQCDTRDMDGDFPCYVDTDERSEQLGESIDPLDIEFDSGIALDFDLMAFREPIAIAYVSPTGLDEIERERHASPAVSMMDEMCIDGGLSSCSINDGITAKTFSPRHTFLGLHPHGELSRTDVVSRQDEQVSSAVDMLNVRQGLVSPYTPHFESGTPHIWIPSAKEEHVGDTVFSQWTQDIVLDEEAEHDDSFAMNGTDTSVQVQHLLSQPTESTGIATKSVHDESFDGEDSKSVIAALRDECKRLAEETRAAKDELACLRSGLTEKELAALKLQKNSSSETIANIQQHEHERNEALGALTVDAHAQCDFASSPEGVSGTGLSERITADPSCDTFSSSPGVDLHSTVTPDTKPVTRSCETETISASPGVEVPTLAALARWCTLAEHGHILGEHASDCGGSTCTGGGTADVGDCLSSRRGSLLSARSSMSSLDGRRHSVRCLGSPESEASFSSREIRLRRSVSDSTQLYGGSHSGVVRGAGWCSVSAPSVVRVLPTDGRRCSVPSTIPCASGRQLAVPVEAAKGSFIAQQNPPVVAQRGVPMVYPQVGVQQTFRSSLPQAVVHRGHIPHVHVSPVAVASPLVVCRSARR